MKYLAVQYLEGGTGAAELSPDAVRDRLRAALERVQISFLLIGWNLPDKLIDTCAQECSRAGIDLYLWQPLLTGDNPLPPPIEWQTIGLDGEPVAGFRRLPEFTFLCPNRPPVRDSVLAHLENLLGDGRYQGVFLDRIRMPSPSANPSSMLACFCDSCHLAAEQRGLDLVEVQEHITDLLRSVEGAKTCIRMLLDPFAAEDQLVALFLDFRQYSISEIVQQAAQLAHDRGLSVGLDCFSPALTRMVGQDLAALDGHSDWIKIMSYGHVMAPAGLSYELLGLADWVVERHGISMSEALSFISAASGLPLTDDREGLIERGLSSEALALEAQRARQLGVITILAGMELVDLEGIARLNDQQIRRDYLAFEQAGVDGLVLSWDLWHIPLERLQLVCQ